MASSPTEMSVLSASQIAAAFPARPRTWVYRHLPRQSSSAGWSFGLVSASSIARPGVWHLPPKDRSYLERAREILGAIDAAELRQPAYCRAESSRQLSVLMMNSVDLRGWF